MKAEDLSAQEAAERLGVKLSTLYAYASRGLIRSRGRGKYSREDVERLLAERDGRHNPLTAFSDPLHFGVPLLSSGLTYIGAGRYYYRGIDALDLAGRASVEQVANLLWSGVEESALPGPRRPAPELPGHQDLVTALGMRLVLAAHVDWAASAADPRSQLLSAVSVLELLYSSAERQSGLEPRPELPLHRRLGRAWRASGAQEELLRTALILSADHELNASSFTARCAASSGATLYHAALAGWCALQGSHHGQMSVRCAALLAGAEVHGAERAMATALERWGEVPGFGHPLYPEGDPRGRLLTERVLESHADRAGAVAELCGVARQRLGLSPNLDLGLAAVTRSLGRPEREALALFALGRAVGWLAHSLEAQRQGVTVRPRARYSGPGPS